VEGRRRTRVGIPLIAVESRINHLQHPSSGRQVHQPVVMDLLPIEANFLWSRKVKRLGTDMRCRTSPLDQVIDEARELLRVWFLTNLANARRRQFSTQLEAPRHITQKKRATHPTSVAGGNNFESRTSTQLNHPLSSKWQCCHSLFSHL